MSFLGNVGHFLGSLFGGGNNDDDEKKKQQQQQQAAATKTTAPAQPALSVQPLQDNQALTVAPAQNDVNVSTVLKKVNGNNPTPKQVAAQKFIDDNGGPVDPNYKSKSPGLLDMAGEAAKGIGSSLVKVGNAAAGDVQHLGNVISYPIVTHEYNNMVKTGQITPSTAVQLEDDARNKAGFGINDSTPTLLRKVTGAVAGPTATILTAGTAPEIAAGARELSPTAQAVRAAGSGSALGAGFGGIQTLDQNGPVKTSDVVKNVGLGAVTGAALGLVAPSVTRAAGNLTDRVRPNGEIAPGVTSGANPAGDLTEHSAAGSILDTPAYLRNRLALPAPRENLAVPIDPNTPEGNVLLNQNKPQIMPTDVQVRPAVPARTIGLLDKTNSRIVDPQVIPGSPAAPVVAPGRNLTDIGAPTAAADPALLQKARDTAIAKAMGAENVAPYVPTPGSAPVEQLIKRIENPAGSSDTQLLKAMNDLITHPDAPQGVKEWAMSERDKLTGVADRTAPAAPAAPTPDVPAPVAAEAPASHPLADVLPAAPSGESVATSTEAQLPGGEPVASVVNDGHMLPPVEASSVVPSTDEARQALIEGLQSARTQSIDDAANLAAGRSARAGRMMNAADGLEGQAATDARRMAMAGSFDHRGQYTGMDDGDKVFDALRLQAQTHPDLVNRPYTLDNVEEALSRATTGKSLDGKIENAAPTDAQINLLRKYFGDDVANAVKDKVDSTTRFRDKLAAAAGEVAAVPKSIMASFDMSATLRQGGVLASRFPKEAAQAAVEQVRYFASKDHYEAAMKAIEDDPYFEAANKSGLALTGVSSLDQAEEQFVGKLINKVPGIAGSDRAYAGFLTKLRFDTFKSIVDSYAAKGVELGGKELDDVSKFINTASGRGDLGQFFEKHANTLNTALFSPRLWKSRFDMLNPVYYARLSGPARKYALQSAATFAGTAATVLGLASLAGAHVETNPTSSDFLKIKMGNTRYDILGGFQQNLVFLARELTGESTSSTTGETTKFAKGIQDIGNPNSPEVSKGPFAGNRLTKLTDLVSNKLNPLLSAGGHILSGKGIGGQPVNVLGELANLVVPLGASNTVATANDAADLSTSDLAGSAKELGKAALKNVPDFFGVSTQTYGDVPTKYQPANMTKAADAGAPRKVPDAVQQVIDKKAEAARVADFKKRDIPENQAGVDQRFQNNEFDKAIEGTKHLEDVANKKEELSVTDKAKYDLQINRAQTMKDKGIKYADFADYSKTSLSEWRDMGDPKKDTYDPDTYQRLYEMDQTLAAGKGSDNSKDPSKPKFTAKAPSTGGRGRGGGGLKTITSNTIGSLPTLAKVSLGNLAPVKITNEAKMPTIQRVQPGELVKKRAISVGKR